MVLNWYGALMMDEDEEASETLWNSEERYLPGRSVLAELCGGVEDLVGDTLKERTASIQSKRTPEQIEEEGDNERFSSFRASRGQNRRKRVLLLLLAACSCVAASFMGAVAETRESLLHLF